VDGFVLPTYDPRVSSPTSSPVSNETASTARRGIRAFSTSRADEAVAAVEQLYGPHALLLNHRRGLHLQLSGFDLGRLSVSRISYGCPAIGKPAQPNDYWVFSSIVSGEVRVGGEIAGAATACVRAPGAMTEIPMSADLRLANLKVGHADLLDARALLLGYQPDEPLRFVDCMPAQSPAAVQFMALLVRLQQLPLLDPRFAAPLERRWQEATLLELLLVFPGVRTGALGRGSAPRGAMDRAVDLIDADPSANLTLGDLARASGVGIRALSRAFERRLGTSPMRYLQQRRLERARSDLLDGMGNVTAVALQWGFSNLGDFAKAYRARFGELPRQTRDRGKRG
jgi:AraC-like DNA-binding protein